MAEQQKQVALRNDVGEQVITRINQLSETGLQMPKDFHAPTAIRMTMLKLQELKDKNGKPALEVCTKESIANALFRMCLWGLNCGLDQCYATVKGDKLCIDPSYFGKALMVKRVYNTWHPRPHVIRKDDVFEFEIESKTGLTKLVKHETKLENIDKPFVGAYIYLPTENGDLDLYIMSAKQIATAWSKSPTRQGVHQEFDEKMVGKTIINSACNMIIKSTPSINYNEEVQEDNHTVDAEYEVFEEEDNKPNKPQPQVAAPAQEPTPAPEPTPQNGGQPSNGDFPFPQNDDDF